MRCRGRLLALPAPLVATLLAAAPGASARESARFVYTHPADDATCPDEDAMRRTIAAGLGYDPFDAAATTVVRASIERAAGGLRGRVAIARTGSPERHRVVDAARDCASVANALALAVVVAIDANEPSAAPATTAPEPSPREAATPPASQTHATAPSPPAPRAPETVKAAPPDTTPSAPSSIALRTSAAPRVSFGTAPAAAVGAAVALGVRWPVFSVVVEGRADLPASAPLSTGGSVDTSLVVGMLVACGHLKRFVGCPLFAVGSMRGESVGVASPSSGYGLYGAAGARVGVELPLSRTVSLRPETDLLFAWARPDLGFDGRTVWTAPPVSGTLGLACVLDLGRGADF